MEYVPVINQNNQPLMPTKPAKARRLIKRGDATPFFKNGVFCIKLNHNIQKPHFQPITASIDPGSKKEAITVQSEVHTILNIQTDARTGVKEKVKVKSQMRRGRRFRNCRRRPARFNNRKHPKLPPSTRARWAWKLKILKFLYSIFPITDIIVEDIKAKTKGKKKWDKSFSPLEQGKKWFYSEVKKLGNLILIQGYETAMLRNSLGLKKSNDKLSNNFSAHCLDSWVIGNSVFVHYKQESENKEIMYISPIDFHRRQLHRFKPEKGGIRKPYGGTISLGLKRGTLVRHVKRGLCYVGGCMEDRISLHRVKDGKRLCQNAKVSDCKILSRLAWQYY